MIQRILVVAILFAISIEGFGPQYSPFLTHEHLQRTIASDTSFFGQASQNGLRSFQEINNIDDFLTSLKKMAEKVAKCWAIPGLNIGIVINNQTYTLTAGLDADINTETNFGIGSTSKAFTSTMIGQLVDEGILDWNTPVREYTPRFSMLDPVAAARVTLRDMLTHKTGMPDHSYDIALIVQTPLTREELFYDIKTLAPAYDFRSQWQYSNMMVMAAAHVAEEVTGSSWEDLVTKRIFQTVGMQRTCAGLDCAINTGNLAMPTLQVSSDPVTRIDCGYECERFIDVEAPAGAVYSNVEDLVKWVQIHLNSSDIQLVSPATLKELHKPQTNLYPRDVRTSFIQDEDLISIETHSYAYNWFVENYRGLRNVQHGGTTIGFCAQISLLPDVGVGFVGVSSGDNTNHALNLLSYYAYDLLLFKKSWVTETTICPASTDKHSQPVKPKHEFEAVKSDLSEFAGSYQHPYFSTITFTYDSQADLLAGTWGKSLVGNASYLGDNFVLWNITLTIFPEDYPYRDGQFVVEFQRNINGDIDSMACNLQDGTPAVVFTNDKWIPRGVGWPSQ